MLNASYESNCKSCEPKLLDHAYGLLDAAEAQAVVAHLAACPACSAQVARLGGLYRLNNEFRRSRKRRAGSEAAN